MAVWVKVPAVWVMVSAMVTKAPETVWVLPRLSRVMALEISRTLPVEFKPTPPLKVWE